MMEDALNQSYSVLMSVYMKEKAEYLQKSMESIFAQTILTNDFVLVCDGPLGDELNAVIEAMQKQYPEILHVVRLEQNMGLGRALNYGLKRCRNELVARMDSDDISRIERCEKQLRVFIENPTVTIVSGSVEEFDETPEKVTVQRALPETHEEIYEFAKRRNPFNHPCVMYKKSAVEAAGGYKDFYLLEDYYLWVRMLLNGSKGYNLQEPLLWMRAGAGMYKRRSGWKYVQSQKNLFRYMRQSSFITYRQELENKILRIVAGILPNAIRKKVYEKKLRIKS